jgi:putative ABC transport system permease protein
MTAWLRDIRYASRALRGNPGFAIAAFVTMTIAIAATTAMFSVVNAVLLRPLPVPDARAIVAVGTTTRDNPLALGTASLEEVADWERLSKTVAAFGAWRDWGMLRYDGTRRESVYGIVATPSLFDVFRLRPALGRLLTPADDQPGAAGVVVLTDSYWRRRFGGDADVLGRTLVLERGPKASYIVVGVLPPAFNAVPSFEDVAVIVPSASDPDAHLRRTLRNRMVFARLRPGARPADAANELAVIGAQLAAQYPVENGDRSIRVEPIIDYEVGSAGGTLRAFFAAVGLLLLIAVANVAGLQLARAMARGREFSIRRALGGGRGALVRALVSETALLSVAAGTGGLLLSGWIVDLVVARGPALPRAESAAVDSQVFVFTAALCVAASLLLALPAVLLSTRIDVARALKEQAAQIAGARALGARTAFVGVQAALALMLVVGAASAARALVHQLSLDPGFEPHGLAWLSVYPPMERYRKSTQVTSFYADVIAAARTVPGVRDASAVSATPLSGEGAEPAEFMIEGRPTGTGARPVANTFNVAPGYFRTLGPGLVRGRDFGAADGPDALPVAIVNDAFVRRFLGGTDPLRTTLRLGAAGDPVTIVGVAADVLQTVAVHAAPQPEIYLPYSQRARWATLIVVRTTGGSPATALAALKDRIAAMDAEVQTGTPVLMVDRLQRSSRGPAFVTLIFGFFAGIALLLSATGIAGLVLYTTAQRSREIAVRISLGATAPDIVRVVGKGAFGALGGGSAAGLVGSLLLSRALAAMVPDFDPAGAALSWSVAVLFLLFGGLACYLPARRAVYTDPAAVMRQ